MAKFAFISTMSGETWGGSEQLWGATAQVLLRLGHQVAAGVNHWPGPHREWDALRSSGCSLHIREFIPKFPARIANRLLPTAWKFPAPNSEHEWLRAFQPDLVIVCQAWTDDGLEMMERCRNRNWKFASVVQAASEFQWPDDVRAARLSKVYQEAAAAFFVSRHNLELTEQQIACRIPRGEIVWNPFKVNFSEPLPWPEQCDGIKLACVGRLQPDAKGQDLLLRVLAQERWRNRAIEVTFFGKGVNRHQIENLAVMLGVRKVRFGGFASDVSEIWKTHHALVLPSRKEGMPIVLLEASLCGRPAICNSVAGVPEIVDDGVTGFLSGAPEARLFGEALERAWEKRFELQEMGKRASARVRGMIPENPAAAFAERLIRISEQPHE